MVLAKVFRTSRLQVGTGQTLTTSIAGTYTAKCTSGSCTSAASNGLVIAQAAECFAADKCILNKVRLLYRTSFLERLNGAKIQGSNDGATWTDIYTIGVNGTGNWQEFTFTNTVAYQHIRYAASPTGAGELREIEFYEMAILCLPVRNSVPNRMFRTWDGRMQWTGMRRIHGMENTRVWARMLVQAISWG